MGDAVRYNKTLALFAAGRKRYSAASGDVISFDGDGSPLRGLTVGIEPVQSGSGDPSPDNVRPISGWTGATVFHSGADPTDPEEIAVSWADGAGTVYGGTLDVLSGVLTVDTAGMVFTGAGDEPWQNIGSGGEPTRFFRYTYTGSRSLPGYTADRGCSHFKNATIFTSGTAIGYSVYTPDSATGDFAYVQIRPGINGIDTVYSWKNWLSGQAALGTPVTCWWEIAEPITYQLTPQQIDTLLGENRIWADTGPVSAAYRSLEDAQRSKLAVLLRNRGRDET